ncbi:hypothetical protein [Paenibacillus luteus]|uniref:hypothetical protein n=1 Tax=Paenibacillus luteus TaxID=2545753 RepID=UPI001141E711|nr:hypothetical protein [Paenibacillus luteus]
MNRYREGMHEIRASEEMKQQFIQQTQLRLSTGKSKIMVLMKTAALTAAACVILVMTVLFISPSQISIQPKPFSGFIITAYAADGTALILKPNVQLPLGQYSPLMSSVPGLPITIASDEADDIVVAVSEGNLSLWSPSDSKVHPKGKQLHAQPGITVYWSPSVEENTKLLTKKSIVSIIAYKNNAEIGRRTLEIQAADGSFYNGILMED